MIDPLNLCFALTQQHFGFRVLLILVLNEVSLWILAMLFDRERGVPREFELSVDLDLSADPDSLELNLLKLPSLKPRSS